MYANWSRPLDEAFPIPSHSEVNFALSHVSFEYLSLIDMKFWNRRYEQSDELIPADGPDEVTLQFFFSWLKRKYINSVNALHKEELGTKQLILKIIFFLKNPFSSIYI